MRALSRGLERLRAVYATLNSPVGDWVKVQQFQDGGSYMVAPSTRVIPLVTLVRAQTIGARSRPTRSTGVAKTSANRSGEPTPADGEDVVAVFGEAVDVYLLDDAPLAGAASTVVDLAHGEATVLRAGALDPAEVLAVLRTT